MLGFLASQFMANNKKQQQTSVCASINQTLHNAVELGALAAEQISEAMADAERALKITDLKTSAAIEVMSAKYAAMGMSASEYSSLIQSEIETIATIHGCKLTAKPT